MVHMRLPNQRMKLSRQRPLLVVQIFLDCGRCTAQLMRDSLGAQPEPVMAASHPVLLLSALAACHSGGTGQLRPSPLDSASAVRLALVAVADTTDTLVSWEVAEYSHTRNGYVIYISPRIKPEYAHPRPGWSTIINDGGGRVHISNSGKITLIEVY